MVWRTASLMDSWDATASELLFGAIDEEVIEEVEVENDHNVNEQAGSEDEWYDVE